MMRFLLYLLVLVGLTLPQPTPAEVRVPTSSTEISLSFAPIVRATSPAVVNIYARRGVAARRSQFADDPFFRNFFGDAPMARPRIQNSLGAGVIVSPEGLVGSNYHVVGQATEIRVVLSDRREIEAQIIFADEGSDLGILKLATDEPLGHSVLRDSDTIEVGDLVLPPNDSAQHRITLPQRNDLSGLSASKINPAVQQELDLPMATSSVVAEGVGALSARFGVRPGDIILGINGRPVQTTQDLLEGLAIPARSYQVELQRGEHWIMLRYRA